MAPESTGTRPDRNPPPPPRPYSPGTSSTPRPYEPYGSEARPYTGTRGHRDFAIQRRIAAGVGWFGIALGVFELAAPRALARLIGLEAPSTRWRGARRIIERTGVTTRLPEGAARLLPERSGDPVHWMIIRGLGVREIASGVGILARPRPAAWLWSRVVGDMMDLALLGLALNSSRTDRVRLAGATAAVAGVTALDVYCSQQLTEGARDRNIRVRQSIIVDRTPSEVYQFWRNENNWPQFMENVESVHASGDGVRWKVRVPGRREINWETRITNDVPDSLIGWQSTDGSDVDISGTVRFERAPGDRGTLVSLAVQFTPPGGAIGAAVARMFESIPTTALEMCLRKAKQVMETGEVARSDASIFPGMHPAQPPERVPELAFAH